MTHLHSASWQYGLWSFQMGGTKLERFLPKNQHTQRKLLNQILYYIFKYLVKSDSARPTNLPKNLMSYVNAPYYKNCRA